MSALYTVPLAVLIVVTVLASLELGHRLTRLAPVGDVQASITTSSVLGVVGL